jgi:hypothetical protein
LRNFTDRVKLAAWRALLLGVSLCSLVVRLLLGSLMLALFALVLLRLLMLALFMFALRLLMLGLLTLRSPVLRSLASLRPGLGLMFLRPALLFRTGSRRCRGFRESRNDSRVLGP